MEAQLRLQRTNPALQSCGDARTHLASLTGASAAQHWLTDDGSDWSEPPIAASAALTSTPPLGVAGAAESAAKLG